MKRLCNKKSEDSIPIEEVNDFSKLKTTGQMALDLGSLTTHIAGLVAVYRGVFGDNESVDILKWVLIATITFQGIIGIGLFVVRRMDIKCQKSFRLSKKLNYIFFVLILAIAGLEAFIGVYEKFGITHPTTPGDHNCTNVH